MPRRELAAAQRERSYHFHGRAEKAFARWSFGLSVSGMKFTVTLDRDEDGVWVAECPAIPGCVSQGRTRDEALKNLDEAIRACLEVRAERGMPLTLETRQLEIAV